MYILKIFINMHGGTRIKRLLFELLPPSCPQPISQPNMEPSASSLQFPASRPQFSAPSLQPPALSPKPVAPSPQLPASHTKHV